MRRALFALALLFAPANARADIVDRCVDASERGQAARRRGALIEARDAFIECGNDRCPALVRSACGDWLDQVRSALPTLSIAVSSADGTDIAGVRITIDGKPAPAGKSTAVDPGARTIAAEAEGWAPGTVTITALEGERSRVVRLTLAPLKKEVRAEPRAPERAERPEREGVRPVTWITGGLAVGALGSFAFFGASGRIRAGELRDTCAPACPTADRDAVHTRYIVADVSLAVALILGGVSVWTLLARSD